MTYSKALSALFMGLALMATAQVHAQSAVLVDGVLILNGSNSGDAMGVRPNPDSNGYIVEIGRTTSSIFDVATGRRVNSVSASRVSEIEILGRGGGDYLYVGENFRDEDVFDANPNLRVFIDGGSGGDEIDPGTTGYRSMVLIIGGSGGDTLHRYYTRLSGVRFYLSPPMLDFTVGDDTEDHQVGSVSSFPTFGGIRRF